jgi:hypothetical protein
MPIGVSGAVALGAAAIGAGGSLLAAQSAGKSASGAATQAADLQEQQYQTTRGDLAPYTSVGVNALEQLQASNNKGWYAGYPNYLAVAGQNVPPMMTQEELEKTPGYQFNLSQGLKSTQSAAAARGLGVSGAALKGAATYATGLADSTYQNQFNNKQTIFGDYLNMDTAVKNNANNAFDMYLKTAQLGEGAAAATGVQGTAAAANAGNYLNQAGQATAAGTVGAGNALSSGINNYLAYSAFTNATGSGGGTGGYVDNGLRFN